MPPEHTGNEPKLDIHLKRLWAGHKNTENDNYNSFVMNMLIMIQVYQLRTEYVSKTHIICAYMHT